MIKSKLCLKFSVSEVNPTSYATTEQKTAIKDKRPYSLDSLTKNNPKSKELFELYTRTVYSSYGQHPNLESRLKESFESDEVNDIQTHLCKGPDHLSNYSNYASLDTLHELVTLKGVRLLTARNSETNELVGFATFFNLSVGGKDSIYISQLGSKYRGQGIGSELTKKVISLAQQNNLDVTALTRASNENGKELFVNKLGFVTGEQVSQNICEALEMKYDGRTYMGLQKKQ